MSSANKFALVNSKQLGRSLMYNRNRIGPRLEPCGTLHHISLADDILPFTELPLRYESNHLRLFPLIPYNLTPFHHIPVTSFSAERLREI